MMVLQSYIALHHYASLGCSKWRLPDNGPRAGRDRLDIDAFQEGAKDMRVFYCQYCDHHLRFGPAVCSACSMPTPVANRTRFWVKLVAAVMLAAIAAFFLAVF
ncbi:hypothetical protein [Martelella lutilitoris]|nr:hypothetical protein [Martelella lutilitoris]